MIPRYEVAEISKIWSDENKFRRWLDVELAVCRAWTEKGVIPENDFENIKAKAAFNVDRIHEIEAVTHHDMIAFNSCVAETVGESGRYVHLGLTSSDVIDTASSLMLGESLEFTVKNIEKLRKVIGEKAVEYKKRRVQGERTEYTPNRRRSVLNCSTTIRSLAGILKGLKRRAKKCWWVQFPEP